jgi:hypothetical protein
MLCFDHVRYYLIWDNEGADIRYSMSYLKVLEWSRDDSSSYVN